MNNLIDSLRQILGTPDFYSQLMPNSNYTWDYGAMIEYSICGVLLCIIVSSVFRFLRELVK